jgi:drug/metabolite transporter (DMT)-like permease
VAINAVACFLLLNAMLRRWDATRVGKLFFVTPLVTAVLAWLLIAQPLRPLTIAGLGIGLIGMVLASLRSGTRRDAAPAGEPTSPVPGGVREHRASLAA